MKSLGSADLLTFCGFPLLRFFEHQKDKPSYFTHLQNCLKHREPFSAKTREGHQPLVSDFQLFLSYRSNQEKSLFRDWI